MKSLLPHQILAFVTCGKTYNNNKFKIFAQASNDKFELPNRLYSVSDIQDFFEYILKKHGENINKSSVLIHVNKIENRLHLKLKMDIVLNF